MEILPQLIVNSLIAGSLYALASSGLSLTFGLLRILNFAHGHLMMVGAYAFYFGCCMHEWGYAAAAGIALFVMILLSLLVLTVFILPFQRYDSFLPFVTTIALSAILESLVSIFFGVEVKSLSQGLPIESFLLFGAYLTPIHVLILGSSFVLLSTLAFVVHSTSAGRMIRAIAENPSAAEAVGIARSRIVAGIFTVSLVLAGYAGILAGLETNVSPYMGNAYTIKAFAAMVLGGLGNIWGTVAGSYILGFVENFSIGVDIGGYSLPAGYKDAFSFVIILAVLLFRPQGIFRSKGRAV